MNTINVENAVEILYDDTNIFLLRKQVGSSQVQVLDSELNEIALFEMQYFRHTQAIGCVDKSAIYLPTGDGLILVLDKFSGEEFYTINPNSSFWISAPKIQNETLYVMSVVPISTGTYIKTNIISLQAYTCNTGKRLFQSQSMRGVSPHFSVNADAVHVAVGREYFQYDLNCHLVNTKSTSKVIDYDPIASDRIYLSSHTGTIDVLDKTQCRKLFVAQNSTAPVYTDAALWWFTHQGLFRIGNSIDKIVPVKNKKFIFSGVYVDRLVGVTNEGETYVVDKDGLRLEAIVSSKNISFPHLLGNRLIMRIDNLLYSLEI